jgi:hypothetical protein
MAKKVRTPLGMGNAQVTDLKELQEHFDLASVLAYCDNGRLVEWLEERYYEDEAGKIAALDKSAANFKKQLCAVLGVPYESGADDVDMDEISANNKKREKLKQYTADDDILDNADKAAFTQEDLADLLDNDVKEIYLCGDSFNIPLKKEGVKYIGINNPLVNVKANEPIVPEVISFERVRYCESYEKVLEGEVAPNTIVGTIYQFSGYDWRVLDVQDGKALLLSEEALISHDSLRHYKRNYLTWDMSDIRAFLHGEFLYDIIEKNDRARIVETKIVNSDNPWTGINGGEDTYDRIFLLSIEEVVKYFGDSGQLANRPSDDEERIDDEYNEARKAYFTHNNYRYTVAWMLRSPGTCWDYSTLFFAGIDPDGTIGMTGPRYSSDEFLRPALWLKL